MVHGNLCYLSVKSLLVHQFYFFSCFVDRASWYIHLKKKTTWYTVYLQYISSNTSTCFRRTTTHHQEVHHMDTTVGCLLSWQSQDNRQPSKQNISTNCCIHMVHLLMMGCSTPKTCRGVLWNILKINCASSCFFL